MACQAFAPNADHSLSTPLATLYPLLPFYTLPIATMTVSVTLDAVPQEVLEQIAFLCGTHTLLGPPSGLIPLLLTNRKIYSRLSTNSSPHLYGHIYASKFDIGNVSRRLSEHRTTPQVLTNELQRRFLNLTRIRRRSDAISQLPSQQDEPRITSDLILEAYLMMLENEGKNEQQLCEYAQFNLWLRDYWFHEQGASQAVAFLRAEKWLPDSQERSLAMWLFWFLLNPANFRKDDNASWEALNTLKTLALAAHKYTLTNQAWSSFTTEFHPTSSRTITYFSEPSCLAPLPLSTPAILSFLTLVNRLVAEGVAHSTPLPASQTSISKIPRQEWEYEWMRCLVPEVGDCDKLLSESFRPGSIEGIWEGLFTYTEFTAYAQLLNGGSPVNLQKSMVVRHRQTWKLREHHLMALDPSHSDSGIELDSNDYADPLSPGGPLTSYFPPGTRIKESSAGIEVYDPVRGEVLNYRRASNISNGDKRNLVVQDIIVTGEGHSAWGQFNLIGRIRPCDGFISLSKDYVDGDRGKWLYRGYMIGSVHTNLAGRWRDTLSPADDHGYEGCFAMSRRR